MIIELKNSETGKIANWKLSTRNLIYDNFTYRCFARRVLGGIAGSKVKYENIEKDMTILLKPKQIESALGNISDRGEPGGIKALKKALQELQEEVEEYPPPPLTNLECPRFRPGAFLFLLDLKIYRWDIQRYKSCSPGPVPVENPGEHVCSILRPSRHDGGILWEAYTNAEMFIGLSITGKGSAFGKVPIAPKRW